MFSIKKYFREYTTPLGLKSRDGLPYWQEKILLYLMFIFMVFVPVSYVPSVILSIKVELWFIAIADTLGYAGLIYMFIRKDISVNIRISTVLVIAYLLGIMLLLIVGPFGAGYLWLFIVPILVSIFLKSKIAIISVLLNLLTLIGLGFAYEYNLASDIALTEFSLQSWIVICANFMFLEIITTISIVFIIRGLEKSLQNEKIISESLIKKSNELRDAKEAAEKSDLMKSNFLAQMSHEIRSPINTVMNFISLVKEKIDTSKDDEADEYFKTIKSGSERIIRTIDMILSMSEVQSGAYEPETKEVALLDDILNPLITEFKQVALKKKLKLNITNLVNGTDIVEADHYSLMQVFANLLDNAIKYTKHGNVFIVVSDSDESLKVEIIDTGIGISKEYFSELFEPFSQEDGGYSRRFHGTGLGLALVKKYCELNNSEILVESEKNKGTKFTVTIPRKNIHE